MLFLYVICACEDDCSYIYMYVWLEMDFVYVYGCGDACLFRYYIYICGNDYKYSENLLLYIYACGDVLLCLYMCGYLCCCLYKYVEIYALSYIHICVCVLPTEDSLGIDYCRAVTKFSRESRCLVADVFT